MKFSTLLDEVAQVNQRRFPGGSGSASDRFKDMVHGWLINGCSVAAIFSGGRFISVHQSEHQAVANARGLRNSGQQDLKVKRIVI